MKTKKIAVSLLAMCGALVLLCTCTMGGVESALVGTWKLSSLKVTPSSTTMTATDISGTFIISADDHYKISQKYTVSSMEFDEKESGKLTASYSGKTLTLDPYGDDEDTEYDYVLTIAATSTLTLETTTSSGTKVEIEYTK